MQVSRRNGLLTPVEAKETIVMDERHSVAKELFNQVDDEDVVIVENCDAEETTGEEENWKEVVCRKAEGGNKDDTRS